VDVSGGGFARHADEKMAQLGGEIAQGQDGEHISVVKETQFLLKADHVEVVVYTWLVSGALCVSSTFFRFLKSLLGPQLYTNAS